MPAKVALAPVRDNQVYDPVPTKPRAKPEIITAHTYAVFLIQRLLVSMPSTAAVYAALAGLISEQV